MNKKENQKLSKVHRDIVTLKTNQATLRTTQKHLVKKVDHLVSWKEEFMENHWPHLLIQVEANKFKIALISASVAFVATFIAQRLLERL